MLDFTATVAGFQIALKANIIGADDAIGNTWNL